MARSKGQQLRSKAKSRASKARTAGGSRVHKAAEAKAKGGGKAIRSTHKKARHSPTARSSKDDAEFIDDEFHGFSDSDRTLDDRMDNDIVDEPDEEMESLTKKAPAINQFLGNVSDDAVLDEPCETLTLAGDAIADYFNTSIEAGHEDDAQRGVAATVYFRRHCIGDSDMRTLIAPKRHTTKSPNYQLNRDRYMKWQTKFQGKIFKWLTNGVEATYKEMIGSEVFKNATAKDRRDLWTAIFEQHPRQMAKGSLGSVAGSVPVDEIFSASSVTHRKWQAYLKTTFVWAADNVYMALYITGDMKACRDAWKAMPNAAPFKELKLGPMDQTPVKAGGVYDPGSRQLPSKPTYNEGNELRW